MYDELVKRLRAQADAERFYSGEKMLYDEAADAIEELKQIAEHYEETARDYYKDVCYYLERVPKWIPATERLPNDHESVLVYNPQYQITVGYIYGGGQFRVRGVLFPETPTYWMPLPEPPKDGAERAAFTSAA